MADVLYTRALTRKEKLLTSRTHDYMPLSEREFLLLAQLVSKRDHSGQIIVDNAFTHRFLYRLGGIMTTVSVYDNTYGINHERNLCPWPLSALDHALVIERMEFPDGQITGYQAKGQFGLLVPKTV